MDVQRVLKFAKSIFVFCAECITFSAILIELDDVLT